MAVAVAVLIVCCLVGVAGSKGADSKTQNAVSGAIFLLAASLIGRQPSHYVHIWVRPALVALGSFIVASARPQARASIVLHLAVVAAVTVSTEPCSPFRYAVDASVLVPLAMLVPWDYATFCGLEAFALATLFADSTDQAIVSRASHLTWWGIGLLGCYDLSVLFESVGLASKRDHVAAVLLPISVVVAIGVLFMSAVGCEMLADAYESAGALVYIVGNFAMHYYPLIRALTASSVPVGGVGVRAAVIVLLYTMAYRPADIYGCSSPPSSIIPPIMVAVTLGVVGLSLVPASAPRALYASRPRWWYT